MGRIHAQPTDLVPRLERHRKELRSHCRRMLGSGSEADDAVQETLVRAWRAYDRFEGRSSLRTWLYRIATNVCLGMVQRQQRRARPMDVELWYLQAEAAPDDRGEQVSDPAEVVAAGEAVREAFVVALEALPPRQRAVLILRDVLRWHSSEVAELLGTTEASVTSALQRARTTLAARAASPRCEPADEARRHLLARYVEAFERTDIQSLVSLLRVDHLGATA
jgi:RNA polymerase sigma-70 factor (ECF subfamily)